MGWAPAPVKEDSEPGRAAARGRRDQLLKSPFKRIARSTYCLTRKNLPRAEALGFVNAVSPHSTSSV